MKDHKKKRFLKEEIHAAMPILFAKNADREQAQKDIEGFETVEIWIRKFKYFLIFIFSI
jgi:hypothetical protein